MDSKIYYSNDLVVVDAVITTFNESPKQINITLQSCIKQSYPFNKIYLVDDGSANFYVSDIIEHPLIEVIQLPKNLGISGARNIGISQSSAEYIACINVEIELEPNWLKLLLENFCECHEFPISAAFGRLVNNNKSFLSNWRMRFHEQQYEMNSGIAKFAPGHAVLFKRFFLDQVKGYNTEFKLVHEDADICFRLQRLGTLIYYNAQVITISYQQDSLGLISKKHFVRITVGRCKSLGYREFLKILLRDHFNRVFRNLVKGRWSFFFLDWKISYKCYKIFIE